MAHEKKPTNRARERVEKALGIRNPTNANPAELSEELVCKADEIARKWKACGLPYSAICDAVVEMALWQRGQAMKPAVETDAEEKPAPIPKSVEEAVETLDRELSDTDKRYVLENGSLSVHHTLGMWIRNNWGLWQDSELKQVMLGLGIEHPDDMSDYIINRFIEHAKHGRRLPKTRTGTNRQRRHKRQLIFNK